MNDICIEILKYFLIASSRIERTHIVYSTNYGYDNHRIPITQEDHIAEESRCSPIAIDEWVDLYKTIVELTCDESGMSSFVCFSIPFN